MSFCQNLQNPLLTVFKILPQKFPLSAAVFNNGKFFLCKKIKPINLSYDIKNLIFFKHLVQYPLCCWAGLTL